MSSSRARYAGIFSAIVIAGGLLIGSIAPAGANHEPANKVSASGSTTEVFGVPNGSTVELLMSETVKTSKPTDLILGVTAECAITTDVTTVGTDTQGAEGLVRVWITIDGKAVPVSSTDKDAGRVVFCNQLHERTTQLGSDDDSDSVRTFLRTRNANGFNWMALNVGSATHKIEVWAELVTDATARSSALAVVGNRTLIVEPVKSANDEAVTEL
jgi:hypothetical protein